MFCKKHQIHSEPLARMWYRCYLKKRMQWKFYVNIGQYECLSEIHMRLDFLVFQKKWRTAAILLIHAEGESTPKKDTASGSCVHLCILKKKRNILQTNLPSFVMLSHKKKTCRFAMVCKRHRNGRQQNKQKVSARIASTTKMYANYFSIVNKKRQQERTRRCHTISLVQLRSVSSMQQKNICEPKVHSIECVGWMIMLLWSIQANTKRIALKYEKIGIYAQILSHWQQCKMNEFLQ